jgi:cytidylate kinase
VLRAHIDINDPSAVGEIAKNINIHLEMSPTGTKTYLNNEDVSEQIREPDIGEIVSTISSYARVREIMVRKQREIAKTGGVVMDGRDIGTAVLPDADLKFFLEADVETRAHRRYDELRNKGVQTNLSNTKEEIQLRDHLDSTRDVSPLKAAPDAYYINTSNLSIEEQVEAVLTKIRNYLKNID